MSLTGKMTDRELTERLLKVSKADMEKFHNQRMKQYRTSFFLAIGCGIIGVIVYFVFANIRWISAVFAVIGFLILGYSGFEREKWKRLYGKMVYLKQSREESLQKQEESKNPYNNKFSNK
ncbi:hypothetical protein NEF87_003473 [Candidatus Lokiarchaeum ossiferum]|uniref:DUF202 domain-containing protein n=1 Tax=Candidatus Lokiarchaeum ossiferum TaxID=2951803 RepID=A0ABY6HUI7_9ARCH|nr:hypothetical protein NEF87_003473 [Candidatus Lokiarchaeum sp. B-35]